MVTGITQTAVTRERYTEHTHMRIENEEHPSNFSAILFLLKLSCSRLRIPVRLSDDDNVPALSDTARADIAKIVLSPGQEQYDALGCVIECTCL